MVAPSKCSAGLWCNGCQFRKNWEVRGEADCTFRNRGCHFSVADLMLCMSWVKLSDLFLREIILQNSKWSLSAETIVRVSCTSGLSINNFWDVLLLQCNIHALTHVSCFTLCWVNRDTDMSKTLLVAMVSVLHFIVGFLDLFALFTYLIFLFANWTWTLNHSYGKF